MSVSWNEACRLVEEAELLRARVAELEALVVSTPEVIATNTTMAKENERLREELRRVLDTNKRLLHIAINARAALGEASSRLRMEFTDLEAEASAELGKGWWR